MVSIPAWPLFIESLSTEWIKADTFSAIGRLPERPFSYQLIVRSAF
jgi:hypothetical protein